MFANGAKTNLCSKYPAMTGQPSFTRHPKQIWDSSSNDVSFTVQQKIVPTTGQKRGSIKRPLEMSDESGSEMDDKDDLEFAEECLESITRKKKMKKILLATSLFSETSNVVTEELSNCLDSLSTRITCILNDIDQVRCKVDQNRKLGKVCFLEAENTERRALEASVMLASTSNCVLQLVLRISMAKREHEDAMTKELCL
jgi:hypothetical protein